MNWAGVQAWGGCLNGAFLLWGAVRRCSIYYCYYCYCVGFWFVGGGGGDIRLVGRYFWVQDCYCIVLFRCGSWDLVVEYQRTLPYLCLRR